MIKIFIICALLCLLPTLVLSENIRLNASTQLFFQIPENWSWAKTPPKVILEETAEHIGHEAAQKGHSPTRSQLLAVAEKRLKTNEVILFNEISRAHMTLDFSPLGKGEKQPGKKTIKLSAKYAGESLQNEEGVSNVNGRISEVQVEGAWYAYRYDADYLHHEQKVLFSGIIGFSDPYWFYLYYTDFLEDQTDLGRANSIFDSIIIKKATQ